jgi:hypothetical protein
VSGRARRISSVKTPMLAPTSTSTAPSAGIQGSAVVTVSWTTRRTRSSHWAGLGPRPNHL